MMRQTLPALAALLLAGCAAVGPNYHLPEKAVVNAPSAQGGFVAPRADTVLAEPPADWWRLYDEPRLDALIQQAFAANTDLRIADANLERSHALLAEAHSRRDVSASADATVNYVQQSAEQSLQHVQPPERYTYNVGVTVGYDLDLFGGIRRGIEAASANDEAMVAARDLVRVNVAAETARAYADICDAGNEIRAARRSIALQQESLALTRKLATHGRAAPFDVTRQSGLVEEVQARIPTLSARQLNAAYRLATLTGRPPEEYDRSLLACDTPLRLHSPIPTGDGRGLLARRPDVRAAERRLAAATAQIGVATAQLYPDIRLGATAGSTGAAVDFLSPLTNRFGFGPSITWDLHRNAVRDRIAAAEASSRASLAAFDGTVLSALRETESALTSYAFSLDRLASLRAARDHDVAVAAQTAELRRGGRISALVALDAERTSANAEQALAAAETETSQDQIAIFLALGGGWQTPSPPAP
jgi:NodT family efflux transporter outer membrane factor (OMF) lipoprotein